MNFSCETSPAGMVRRLLLVAAALLPIACGDSQSGAPERTGGKDPQAVASLADPLAGGCAPGEKCVAPARPARPDRFPSTVIGPEGGIVTTPDGTFSLSIPPGALAEPVPIVVAEVPWAELPEALKALGADRAYRLEPSGLAFAAPATVTTKLSASDSPAIMLVGSPTSLEGVGDQSLVFGAGERTLTARLAHFSYALVKTLDDFTLKLSVDRREARIGDTVVAEAILQKTASESEARIFGRWKLEGSGALESPNGLPSMGPVEFFRNQAHEVRSTLSAICARAGVSTVVHELEWWTLSVIGTVPPLIRGPETRPSLLLKIDVSCSDRDASPDGIPTGLFQAPVGLLNPDGLQVFPGPAASIPGDGPFAAIAGANGAVVVDLRNGLSALNMTSSGPYGRFGFTPLLSAVIVSQANSGPTTPAVLIGTGQTGLVRNYGVPSSPGPHTWLFTQLFSWPIIDASAAGGRLVADEVVLTGPDVGLDFVAFRNGAYERLDERIPAWSIPGRLLSAAIPVHTHRPIVLAVTTGTNSGTSSTLWIVDRTTQSVAEVLTVPQPQAGQITCAPTLSDTSGTLCAWPTGNVMQLFRISGDGVPTGAGTLPIGNGAIRAGWGVASDGNPMVATVNAAGREVQAYKLEWNASLVGSARIPINEGCAGLFHAQPFADAGADYVAGTCQESSQYYALRIGGWL